MSASRPGHPWVAWILGVWLTGAAWGQGPLTVTVGPTGATGVDFHSIQAAIDHCATNDPGVGYHTVQVRAGVYNVGDEEAFTTCPTNNGLHGDGVVSMFTTVPTEALIQIPATNHLRGLRLIGAGATESVIDAEQAISNGRVMYIGAEGAQVRGFALKGGRFVGPGTVVWAGAGILVHGDHVLLKDLKVSDCDLDGSRVTAVIANSWGTHLNPDRLGAWLRIQDVEVRDNTHVNIGDAPTGAVLLRSNANVRTVTNLVANARVHSNAGMNGLNVDPGDIPQPGSMVVFGCLSASNGLSGIRIGHDRNYIVNCTIAGNGGNAIANGDYSDWNRVLNCILSGNGAGPTTHSDRDLFFLHNLIREAGFEFTADLIDGYSTGPEDDGTNTTNAPPGFRNGAAGDYRLSPGSAAVDAGGLLLTAAASEIFSGGGSQMVKFVDVNKSGGYTRWVDVIAHLGGYNPTEAEWLGHWVATTDIAGNARVQQDGIDRGCYELPVPVGTVILVR